MFTIVKAPHTVLSQIAKPVLKIDKHIGLIIDEMKQTLLNTHDPQGVGLAAPQIGKALQIFLVKPTTKSPIQIFINPKIQTVVYTDQNSESYETKSADADQDSQRRNGPVKLEGCLSLPHIWGVVHRAPKVSVTYVDEHGKTHSKTFSNFTATIIQHEYDHLNGILFPKRVLEQKAQLYKSHKENNKDVFEEIKL